jgi:diaminopimelate epimerase
MTAPGDIERIEGLEAAGETFDVRFIDTGVPHAVIYVPDTDAVKIREWGRAVRIHERFAPAGTNVDFAQLRGADVRIRTYERGVEDETLACGTGCVAAAAVVVSEGRLESPVELDAKGGRLRVHIGLDAGIATSAALEGPAEIVYTGVTRWGE